jgi:diguanylate cyclase (GGDEF)-like protein
VTAQDAVQLEAFPAHKLESLGLIKLDGNQAKPSCKLYRLYFLQHLVEAKLDTRIIQPEKENQEFQYLGNINISDKNKHTQLVSWHYFNNYFSTNWQQWTREMTVLSLILCEVDYFKFYTDAYGQLAGDECIQQIASTIHGCVRHQAILTIQYEGTKFAALLPHTDASVAFEVADFIRQQVKALGITHDQSKVGGFPSQFITVSLGVASTTPLPQSSPEMLIAAAESALLQSKRKGRDRVNCQ